MKKSLLVLSLSFFMFATYAQHEKCRTVRNWERLNARDPGTALRKENLEIKMQKWIENNRNNKNALVDVYTIPVVVHVLYHTDEENISDAQIQSQLDVLNADFRLQNTDSLDDTHPFWEYTVDSHIDFCLAKQDPDGNATSGITRTYTDSVSFVGNGNEKFSSTGGKDNWDPTKYLNLWVCNLSDAEGTLGYAAFPSDLNNWPAEDGVVIRHQAFGTTGTAGTNGYDVNNLGRTATHEVGHWLNLSHIWGDDQCGDDMVDDTPPAEEENYDCPDFPNRPNNLCGADENGEMYMNYMDYVDDYCMVMFTYGQGLRMRAAIENARSGLLSSQGCSVVSGTNNPGHKNMKLDVYPNPSQGELHINISSEKMVETEIIISNAVGQTLHQYKSQQMKTKTLNLSDLPNGIYFIQVKSESDIANKKVILNK